MKELTFGELKRGLLCCTVYRDCKGCPCFDEDTRTTTSVGDISCTMQLMSAAMNCINILEKDLKEANKRADSWEKTAEAHEREIIGLHESLDRK